MGNIQNDSDLMFVFCLHCNNSVLVDGTQQLVFLSCPLCNIAITKEQLDNGCRESNWIEYISWLVGNLSPEGKRRGGVCN